jgi:hypothetical protein
MFDHAWKNAFGTELHGRWHPAASDDTTGRGNAHDSHPWDFGRDKGSAAADDAAGPGNTHDSHPWAFGRDKGPAAADDAAGPGSTHDGNPSIVAQENAPAGVDDTTGPESAPDSHPPTLAQENVPAAVDDTAGAGSASDSHPLAFGLDNDTAIIGNGGNGGDGGAGGDGGVFGSNVSVDTGNEFHFFVGGEAITAEGSSGFFAELSGMVSGIFSSLFAGFQDNDTVIVGNGGNGGDGGSGGDGSVFNGNLSVEAGNDFNFYFGSEPTAEESSGFFAKLSGMVSGMFSSLFGDGFQDNDTIIIGNGGSAGDGSDGGDGGVFNGDVTVDTGNDFNFFFGSEPDMAEGSSGFFGELPTIVGDMVNSVFAGGFQDNDTVIVGNGGSGGDGGIFNGDTTIDAGNDFNFLLA